MFSLLTLKRSETQIHNKTPSTLIRFQMKTELFCSGYGYRPHYNAENDHRKRSHSKTLFRVKRYENDAFFENAVFWKGREDDAI